MRWLSWLLGIEKPRSKKRGATADRLAVDSKKHDIEHWQFRATMGTKTPLEWLLRHGETADNPSKVDKKHGTWVPVTTARSSVQRQAIGDTRADGKTGNSQDLPQVGGEYLSFLIDHRRIVETPDNGLNALRIDALIARYPKYAGSLTKVPPNKRRRRK